MKTRPRIGMPAQMDAESERQYLSRHYPDAVFGSGGVPVILPLLEQPGVLSETVAQLDGLLLTGSGTDVEPGHYGAEREPGCGPLQPLRDGTDFALIELALRLKKPLLAICFGMQSLNVFLGGTLIQDIPALAGSVVHDNPASQGRPSHGVTLQQGSILEQLAGNPVETVNSTHHQAIERPGGGLEIIARAPDRIIEAVSGNGLGAFVLGVQWHPEKSYAYDAFSRSIFDTFIAKCKESMSL